jgi:hypothetical protein
MNSGDQGYFCHDCDSNFVADIQRQRSSLKPEKRPQRPTRGNGKKKGGDTIGIYLTPSDGPVAK